MWKMSAFFELKLNLEITCAWNNKKLISRSSYCMVLFGLISDNFVIIFVRRFHLGYVVIKKICSKIISSHLTSIHKGKPAEGLLLRQAVNKNVLLTEKKFNSLKEQKKYFSYYPVVFRISDK